MISKPRKKLTKSRSRKNPEGIAKEFDRFLKEKNVVKKYNLAKSLKKQLSDDDANYWNISREHTNFRKPAINELINEAIIKAKKVKNPVKTMFRDTEVVIKHKGNKIIFDEEDADIIKNLIRKQYSDNDDIKDILK